MSELYVKDVPTTTTTTTTTTDTQPTETKCWFLRAKQHFQSNLVSYTVGAVAVVVGVWGYKKYYANQKQ